MSAILKLQTNVPEVLEFQYAEPKEVQSDFTGQQFMFTLVDGRRVYLPPVAAAKIREAGIGARTPFEICRKQVGRSIEFHVVNHNAKTAGSFVENKPAATHTSAKHTTPNDTPAAQAPEAPAPAAAEPGPLSTRFMAAFASAITVGVEVTAYAKRRGVQIDFITDDYRAMATTLFIEANKNGGRS